MKTNISNFASRLVMLALAVCMTMSFVACSDDEKNDPSKELVGTWYQTYDSGATYEMNFYAGGDGSHRNSTGTVEGTLKWKITSPGFLYCKKWFYSNGRVTNSEYGWHYSIKGDVLYLDSDKYMRKK